MKAFLLAAGLGTRLRPLTDSVPKCLVPINGVPLLHIWLETCERYGIREVLINLHHLPEKVRDFVHKQKTGVIIRTSYEEKLLGTAGTILANREFIKGEEEFFILYVDNCTDIDLGRMVAFHRQKQLPLTMALFEAEHPQESGIAVLDSNHVVVDFEEKPRNPKSNLANAGILLASPRTLDRFPDRYPLDFGFDILPLFIGEMYGYLFTGYLRDVGTLEGYRRVQEEWRILSSKEEREMDLEQWLRDYTQGFQCCIEDIQIQEVAEVVEVLWEAYLNDRTVYIFGNGGSAATASHFACDLGKGASVEGMRRLRVLSLNDNIPLMTAIANDISYEVVFKEQLPNLLREGDVVVAITGSGNSPNVLEAIKYARDQGAVTVGILGFGGGKLKEMVDYSITLPSTDYGYVESAHLFLEHCISLFLKKKLESYRHEQVFVGAKIG